MAPAYNPVQSSDLQSQRLQYRKRRRCRGNGLYMTAAAAPAEPEDHAPAHGAGWRRLLDALASTVWRGRRARDAQQQEFSHQIQGCKKVGYLKL